VAWFNRKFLEETSANNAVKYFPYLRERLDGIKEIKADMWALARMSNHARNVISREPGKWTRIGSIPHVILDEATQYYGDDFLLDDRKLHDFFRANPEWSFIYGR